MALVYYKCKMLCPQVLSGMARTLRQVGFTPGKDYDIVVTSIDPMDTPADGAAEKAHFLDSLGTPDAGASVHFLTGQQASISDLASATGFNYVRVPGPGWEDGPVCSLQRDHDCHARRPHVEVSLRHRLPAARCAVGGDPGQHSPYRLASAT